jgi:hypothetical protein
MKRITMMSLAAAMSVMLAGVALAQSAAPAPAATSTPRIDQREANQHARIQQGVKSGQLTRHEARTLHRGQRHVARMENRAKADGVVTPQERHRITRAQNHQSKKIYRLKHNDRTRPDSK